MSLAGVGQGASFQGLGALADGANSNAFDVSGDGAVVVGQSMAGEISEAFRWTAAGGMQSLGVGTAGPWVDEPVVPVLISQQEVQAILPMAGPSKFYRLAQNRQGGSRAGAARRKGVARGGRFC